MTSNIRTITKESTIQALVVEKDKYFDSVMEFKSEGHSEPESEKRAIQRLKDEKSSFLKTIGEIDLEFKNGSVNTHMVAIEEKLLNDHHILNFVLKFLNATVVASLKAEPGRTCLNYESLIKNLVEVRFKFKPNNSTEVITHKIELDILSKPLF